MKISSTIWPLIFLVFACSKNDDDFILPDIEEEPVICEQSACWDNSVYVCRDTFHIDLFTRFTGWTGGDATYSVQLDNGSTVWIFADSFIDQVSEDRSRPSFNLINNALVLQNGDELTTYHGGTSSNPGSYAKPSQEGHWYWPADGTIANGKLYLFMHGFGNDGGGAWDFYRTYIDLAIINTQTFQIEENVRLFDDPTISWGANLMEGAEYTYVYGVRAPNPEKYLYVARTNADFSQAWEYYDGTNWSTDPASASSIFEGVSEQFTVWEEDGIYYLLSQQNLFGAEISLYTSGSPVGPFTNGKVVYCTPETGGDIFTYNAFAHRQVYEDSLLVSYNINSFNLDDLLESADNYRPYFVKIGGWKEN